VRTTTSIWEGAGYWHDEDYFLVPLLGSGGQFIGVMSLDDPQDRRAPDRSTVETVEIFANQAALAIENARLYQAAENQTAKLSKSLEELQKSYRDLDAVSRALARKDQELGSLIGQTDMRAKRLLALHRIASSTAEMRDEQVMLQRIAEATVNEMGVEICLIGLIGHNALRLVAAAGAVTSMGDLDPLLTSLNPMSQVVELHTPLLDRDCSPHGWGASNLIKTLGIHSFISAPITVARTISGAALIGSQQDVAPFSSEDIDVFTLLSNQIGVGLENIRLYEDQTTIAEENARLYGETRERATQLQALAESARVVSSALQREDVIALTLEQIKQVIPYDTASLWLREEDFLRVAGARGFENDDTQLGLIVQVEDSLLFKELSASGKAICVPDVRHDGRFPAGNISRTRSWLGVPLMVKGQSLGLIAFDKVDTGFYSTDHAELAIAFATQTAIALDNARLYEDSLRRARDLHDRSQRLALLNRISSSLSTSLDIHRILEIATREMSNAMNSARVWAITHDDAHDLSHQVISYPVLANLPSAMPLSGNPLVERLRQTLSPVIIDDVTQNDLLLHAAADYWHNAGAKALLVVPLIAGNKLLGIFNIDPGAQGHFNADEIELAQTIANQTAIALENSRLFATTQRYAADLELRVAERTAELEKERDQVETLLRITNELSASLDLDRVVTRTLSLVNDTLGGTQGGLFLLDSQSEELIYRASFGTHFQLPAGGVPSIFRRGEGLVGWVIKNRQAAVVHDLLQDERWIQQPLSNQHRSAICAPLLSSEDSLGAMIFYSDVPHAFNDDQLRLVSAAATQVTSAINNAELYRLIRDQAERLGGMLRANQVETSKSQAILESVADGVLVTDPEGMVTLFNATAERILQLSRDEVLGRPASDFLGFYGARAKNLSAAIRRWSEDPARHQAGDLLAERIELEDNRIVSVLLTPVTSTDEFLGSVSIFRDITREVEVDRIKTEFVTTASHELLTPITPIKGYADLLLMGAAGALTPGQQQAVELIKNNADRLRSLVDDLLDISRIESGKIEMQFAPVPIHEVIGEVVTHLQERVSAQKPMRIVNNVSSDLPWVFADRARLIQIITNLADNAFSYTEADGTITFEAHLEDGGMVVSVRDTGIGLTPEDKARMFERFYRAENPLVMASAGTGLGLSIVQRLVDMHEGKLWAESDGLGCGSTFYVRLKLVA
jgi:PAS domain S-box-containing protein